MKQWFIVEKIWRNINFEKTKLIINNISISFFSTDNFDFTFILTKQNAKTQYWIFICIEKNDEKYVTNLKTVREINKKLQKKCKKKLQIISRQYMINLINYKKFVNKTIDEIWTKIFKLTRKMCAIRSKFKILTTSKKRFVALLRAFSEEYVNVRNYIDVQNDLDFDIAIQKLPKKIQLNTKKTKTKKKRHVNQTWKQKQKIS